MLQALIGPVTGLLDKFIPDADQKAKLAHEIATMSEKHHQEALLAQLEINKDIYNDILRLNIFPNLWGKINDNRLVIRFVTSFETTTREIDEIINRLDGALNRS